MVSRISGINSENNVEQLAETVLAEAKNELPQQENQPAATGKTDHRAHKWQPEMRDQFTAGINRSALDSSLAVKTRGTKPAELVNLTKSEWQQRVLAAAGIDASKWVPARGFDENKETLRKAYEYYGTLYLQKPELEWAGLAKMAGSTVFGGLEKIDAINDTPILGWLGGRTAHLDYVEPKLLQMGKDIFMDLAWQHQAYLEGGIDAIKASFQRGEISKDGYDAWVNIASGDQARIDKGTEYLVRREQETILGPSYADLDRKAGLSTIAMSIIAQSPLPNGRSFEDVVPFGRVSNFSDRWKWITKDMLPALKKLSPEYKRALVRQSVQDLADRKFVADPTRGRRRTVSPAGAYRSQFVTPTFLQRK